MAMDLREIAAAALDEWEVSQNGEPSVQADAEDLDFKATASKAVRGAKGLFKDMMSGAGKSGMGNQGVAGAMMDLQKHDKAKHGGHFDPNTQTCKFREDMAKSLSSMGLLNGQNPEMEAQLKAQLGEKNVNAGASAAQKAQKEGNVDAELTEIQNLVKEKNREQDPSKKAELQRKLDKARDAYYKRNLRDAEYDAMKEMQQLAAESPESAEKVAAVAEKIAENPKMGEVQKDAARNLIEKTGGAPDYDWDGESGEGAEAAGTSPDDPQVKAAEEKRQQDAETMQEAIRRATAMKDVGESEEMPNETEQPAEMKPVSQFEIDRAEGKPLPSKMTASEIVAGALSDFNQNEGETDEEYANRVEDVLNRAQHELADAGLSPSDFSSAARELNMAHQEAVRNLAERQEQRANEERAQKEEAEKNREERIRQARSPERQKELAKEERNRDIDAILADDSMSEAEKDAAIAERADKYDRECKKIDKDAVKNSPEMPKDMRKNADGTTEYDVNGKTYIDLSNLGIDEKMQAVLNHTAEGKEFIDNMGKNAARWNEITSNIPGFNEKLDALKAVSTETQASRVFDVAKANTMDSMAEAKIDALKERYNAATKDTERRAIMKELDAVCADYGIGESNATKTANAKRAEAEGKSEGQRLRNAQIESATQLARDKAEDDRLHKESQRRLQEAKFEYQKAKDAGKQLTKTAAETNPDLINHINGVIGKIEKYNPIKADKLRQLITNLSSQASKDPSKALQWTEKADVYINGRPKTTTSDDGDEGDVVDYNERSHADGGVMSAGTRIAEDGSVTTEDINYTPATADVLEDFTDLPKPEPLDDIDSKTGDVKSVLDGLRIQGLALGNPTHTVGINSTDVSIPYTLPPTRKLNKNEIQAIKQQAGEIAVALLLDDNQRDKVGVSVDLANGKINVNIPNKVTGQVSTKEGLNSHEWKDAKDNMALPIYLGAKNNGKHFAVDLEQLKHLLIAGDTGYGKSEVESSIITSLMEAKTPNELQFVMIDGKGTELTGHNGSKHLAIPVATTPRKIMSALKWVKKEMENRNRLFEKTTTESGVNIRNLNEYNKWAKANGKKTLPNIVTIIDETTFVNSIKGAGPIMQELGNIARSSGCHIIAATQYPTKQNIGGLKDSMVARLGLHSNDGNGNIFSDKTGAEANTEPGQFMFEFGGKHTMGRGGRVSQNDLMRMKKHFADQAPKTQPPNNHPPTPPTGGGGGNGNPPPNNGNTTPTQNNTTASTQNTQPQNANHQSIVHPDAVTGTSIASANDQSPNPDFNKIHYSKDNRLVMDGERQMLRRWEDNYDSKFEDARKFGSDAIATHGMRKFGSMNSVVKDLFSLIKKGGIDKTRNYIGGLYTAPLTMDPREGAYYGIGGPSSVRNESPFLLLAKDGKDLDDSDNIGGILVNPAVVDICEALKAPCPDYVEKLAAEIHKVRPDIFVMPYTKVVDMTRAIKGGHEHSANRNASQSPAQPAKPQKAEPAQQVTTADPAVQTNLTPQQVKTAEAANKAVNVGVENFRNKHQPKGAAQKAEFDKVIGSNDGWAE